MKDFVSVNRKRTDRICPLIFGIYNCFTTDLQLFEHVFDLIVSYDTKLNLIRW